MIGALLLVNVAGALMKRPSLERPSNILTPTECLPHGTSTQCNVLGLTMSVPDHDGGRPMEVNACILITHMVYL
jgi:hypothetical protein